MSNLKRLAGYKTYLFDLDGTLLDSSGDIAHAVNQVRKSLNLVVLDQAEIEAGIGHGATALLLHCLPPELHDQITSIREIFTQAYSEHLCVLTKPYEKVEALLTVLKNDKNKYSILITNKPKRFSEPLLEALGWTDYFDLCLFGDSLSERKPSALPITYALTQFNLSAEQALFIGDTEVDAQAACAAKVDLAIVEYGRAKMAVKQGKYGSKALVIHPSDIWSALEQVESQG